MASHLASLWKWDFLELGNGLFITTVLTESSIKFTWNLSTGSWNVNHFLFLFLQLEADKKET